MQTTTTTAKNAWTLAYRKPRANKIHRVTDWSGTWEQAHDLAAAAYDATGGALQIWYTTTREAELAGFVCEDDIQNMLVDSGKRVPLTETGTIAALGIDPATALPLPAADARAWGYVKPASATIEAAHAEALEMNAERDEAAQVAQIDAWRDRHGMGASYLHREHRMALMADHTEALKIERAAELDAWNAQARSFFARHEGHGHGGDILAIVDGWGVRRNCDHAEALEMNAERDQRPDAYGAEADEPTTEPTDPDDAVKARARLAVALGIDPFGPIPPLTELVGRIVSERDALRAPVANQTLYPNRPLDQVGIAVTNKMDEISRNLMAYRARKHRHAAGGQR